MTFDYSKIRATAERLINRFGQTASLVTQVKTGPNHNPEITKTNTDVIIAVFDYINKEIDGTLIQTGDKKVYLSTAGIIVDPTVENKLVIGGVTHTIKQVKPLSPAGVVVLFELQCRI